MLKIKDNVDLKELEKFGFKYLYDVGCYTKIIDTGLQEIYMFATKSEKSKGIFIKGFMSSLLGVVLSDELANICQDLIEAGLVEKVSE